MKARIKGLLSWIGLSLIFVVLPCAYYLNTTNADERVFREGLSAGENGDPINYCPYAEGSKHEHWKKGWVLGNANRKTKSRQVDKENEWYQEGVKDGGNGLPITFSPYPTEDRNEHWRRGWQVGHSIYEARQMQDARSQKSAP